MIQSVIEKSDGIIQWIDSNIEGVTLKANSRERISAACFDLAQEHHKSIVLLIKNHLTGSSLSLLRLMFEAYIRGTWFHGISSDGERIASDDEIDKFIKKDTLDKTFNELVTEVEKIPGFEDRVLSHVKKSVWKSMNSFVHCGMEQISRRNTDDSIEPNYSNEDKIDALNRANAIALLSFLGIARIANNLVLQKKILDKIKELYPAP